MRKVWGGDADGRHQGKNVPITGLERLLFTMELGSNAAAKSQSLQKWLKTTSDPEGHELISICNARMVLRAKSNVLRGGKV